MEGAGGIGGWYGTGQQQRQQQQRQQAEDYDDVLYVEDEEEPAQHELEDDGVAYGRRRHVFDGGEHEDDDDDDDESEGYSAHGGAGFEGDEDWLGEEGDGVWEEDEEGMAEDEEEYGVEFSHHAGLVSPTAAAACEWLTTSSFDVTPGRRHTSLLRGFTETIVESARQQQRAQDSFERGRVRRAVYTLQRGGYVKKKGEQAKEYKQGFCFLAGDCRALLVAKSHRSKDRAKVLAVFSPIGGGSALPVQAQRGPPQLKHKRDAETPGFAAATFSLRVPTAPAIGAAGASSSGSLGGGLGSNNGATTLPSAAPAFSATVTVATTDLWLSSEGECEEWLRALQVVAAAWAHPAQGPRELVWDAQAGGGGWVEGPRHYIEALAEDLARSSLAAYLEAQARRLRRRTVRRSLNHHHHHSSTSNRNSAALTQSRLGVAVASATTTLQGGVGQGHGHTHLHRMNAVLAAKAAAMRARVNANAAARRDRGVGGVGVGPGRGGQAGGSQALVDMARFQAVPIKRAFHHAELPTEALQAQALRAFRLVMQYMGDLPPEEGEGQEGGPAAAGGGGAAGDGGGKKEGHGGSGAVSRHPHHPHTRLQRVQSQSHRLFSGLTHHPLLSPPSPLVRPPSGEGSGTEEDGGGSSPQQAALLQQLLRLGQEVGELRNELYAAAIAQTTENPSPASVLRGWQLLAAFSRAFPPRDEELRDVAISHADRAATCCGGLQQQQFALAGVGEQAGHRSSHSSSHDNGSSSAAAASGVAIAVAALAHHAYEALLHSAAAAVAAAAATAAAASSPDGWPTTAATAQAQPPPPAPAAGTALLSLREVVALQKLMVPPSVFGCTLEEVLRKELVLARATHGAAAANHHHHATAAGSSIGLPPAGALVEQGNVPLVLQTLVRRFQELNGYEVEGVFRRAAHTDAVAAARRRLEDGAYVVYGPAAVGTDDPLVVADLIKIWLRLLAPEPLIPSRCYAAALDAGQHSGDVRPVARLLREGLPAANAATLQYLVQFLNHCAELAPVNQMTPTNLTIVFSPNLLRHPSNDPLRMVQNAEGERRFVALLMEAVRRGLDAVASGDSPRSGRRSPREGSSPTGASGAGGGKKHGYGRKLTRLIFGAR